MAHRIDRLSVEVTFDMGIAIITGSGGLVGANSVRHFAPQFDYIVGVDNDMRSYFFGQEASTRWAIDELKTQLPNYLHEVVDIRDAPSINALFERYGDEIELVIHTAAQPSHDWAAQEPLTDFNINATGTLIMLEATRKFSPAATFIFTSTNKVYGDSPNRLPLVETESRWELDQEHDWHRFGIPETMSIDATLHSLFGASKVAADIMCQEYGRYFGMNTGVFRGGCLTGRGHSGAELHGFLAYLVRCVAEGRPYTVFGYGGKQVRDNIHADDLVTAFGLFHSKPRAGEVYNIGGGRELSCSMLEAIAVAERVAGRPLDWSYSDENRVGDHMWWISDTRKFEGHFPEFRMSFDLEAIVADIYSEGAERWAANS